MRPNIAIDGPSAAGKSTISDILALRLGYTHLDTGAMYRAVAYGAFKSGLPFDAEEAIAKMIENMKLVIHPDGKVFLDGEDISNEIRTNEMSMGASDVSKLGKVREALVEMQRRIAADGGYIVDGRDIGTVVLKDAKVKIFLTASAEDRAKRRVKQNLEKGLPADYDAILEDIIKRDYQDTHRTISPLKKADDATEIDSSKMSIEEVVDVIIEIVKKNS